MTHILRFTQLFTLAFNLAAPSTWHMFLFLLLVNFYCVPANFSGKASRTPLTGA